MVRSGLALCLGLAVTSVANAGATITLRPQGLITSFAPGSAVTMDILLTQDAGGEARGLRLAQFDFSDTDPLVRLGTAVLPQRATFDYSSVSLGSAQYFQDRELPKVTAAFIGTNYANGNPHCPECFDPDDDESKPWNHNMLVLPTTGEFRVGTVRVVLPNTLGTYLIDAVNADNTVEDNGAIISYGFSIDPTDPQVFWRGDNLRGAAPALAGGQGFFLDNGQGGFGFSLVPEPGTLALLALGGLAAFRRRRTAA